MSDVLSPDQLLQPERPQRFVGRTLELERLSRLIGSERPAVAVVYGRRRIGKSSLIRQAIGEAPSLSFEGIENRPKKEQIDAFVFQLKQQATTYEKQERPRTWREAFMLLEPELKRRSGCIVLDEFQWMANYRSEIVSDLKLVWEQYLSRIAGVSLILCGSIASFMTKKVIKSSALYGRTDLVIHLNEFRLHETRDMLPQYGLDELVEAQMVLGGVPKYLELIREFPSLHLAIDALAFTENGYLQEEYGRIFTSHFGRNPDHQKIVETLASNPYGLFRKALSEKAKIDLGGGLSNHLLDLEMAGFISSVVPFDRSVNSRLIKYYLADAYLRFYDAFIRPALKRSRSGAKQRPFSTLVQSGKYQTWRGRAFEQVCASHAKLIAGILGFSGIEYSYGPYFQSPRSDQKGFQIDLVFDRSDNVMTFCEMKCSRKPIGVSVLKEIDQRAQLLAERFPSRTIQPVLMVHGKISKAVEDSPLLYRIIQSPELFDTAVRY